MWKSDESCLCPSCGADYASLDGIPVLVPRTIGDAHKSQQAQFFDGADHEYEITRPHGTPALYQWLIEEKFRRSITMLQGMLHGASVLTVCGGSGMDAELLARAGAQVVCTDLSPGATRRARERSHRYDVAISPIVADIECLPFADRSFDIVYVHDGLHHLDAPIRGLREMLRVARFAISVNEPAHAAITRIAVKVGAADEEEEAGNAIRRLRPHLVIAEIQRAGFKVLRAERYGMYYRHEAGAVFRVLSRPAILPFVEAGLRGFNRIGGRVGNKLTVQAARADVALHGSDDHLPKRENVAGKGQ
jgi:ubiquinone/menaquinone biosynthesis C-methylase UbiE